ncbi:MAG: DUF3472 domain-containing protein [Planctomycetaceae bacterium]
MSVISVFEGIARAEELTVPGATAYLEPNSGARVTAERGIDQWTDSKTAVCWFGKINNRGSLSAVVDVSGPEGENVSLKLTVGEQSRSVRSTLGSSDTKFDFGTFQISDPGYVCFRLQQEGEKLANDVAVRVLKLNGDAAKDAHFNLKPRRNAASVHLAYPVEKGAEVSAFYCEMTGVEDPIWTYYMACGWHRGYFGMQVNSPTERRIIFSVWDSGNEGVDRKKVADENRVTLVGKGEDVYSGDFGNEGTGGHSHLKFQWKTGEVQKFLVTAEPVSETQTVYSGWYFRPDLSDWMLISSWKAPKEGGYMRGLYSFSENFIGANGQVLRKALYGNQWIRTSAGDWLEVTRVTFSHDPTGREDRLDRFMGVENGQFFLSHGGFVDGFTKYGEPFDRPASGRSPADIKLPPLPAVSAK